MVLIVALFKASHVNEFSPELVSDSGHVLSEIALYIPSQPSTSPRNP